MIVSNKIKDDSSRAIAALLFNILETCRQGDVDIASRLGLDIEAIRKLDKLKPDQIAHLSSSYMRDRCALDIFKLDVALLTRIIELAAADSETQEMIDEFLVHGACKRMMGELFGLRSTQVASRKRFLNVPTIKGRLTVVSVEEERSIYDAWLAGIKTTDYRKRLLGVAKETELSLSKIYRVVLEIEEITNQMNTNKICA